MSQPSPPPTESPSPPESPTSPLNHPNIILQTARQFLSHRNFRRCRHFALQLPPRFPGADQILTVADTLAIAYETTFPNPFRILQVPDYHRNLSQIADRFKKLMDLVTDPNHSFPFADEAEAHLLRAYSKISKPNSPVKNLDNHHYYDDDDDDDYDDDDDDDDDDDQEPILINKGGLIKNHERVLINKGSLIKNQERVLINKGGLIKNQERVLINEGGQVKNEEGILISQGGIIKNQERMLIHEEGGLIKNEEGILINQGGIIKNQERILIHEEGGLIKDPDDEEIEAGVGTVVEGVDQEKKNDDDHMVLGGQKDRDESPKRRKLDE